MKDVVYKVSALLFLAIGVAACSSGEDSSQKGEVKNTYLPYYGEKEFIEGIDKDTIYHTIPYWNFINQDSLFVGKSDFDGKPYIAYFFFSTCPGICPAMTSNMVYVQEKTQDIDINIIAHTVDPMADSVTRLKEYSELYDIDNSNFHFVTGIKQDIYNLGVIGYKVPSQEDALAPGGFLHSEQLMIIDKNAHIRGYYDGTNQEEVDKLIEDIHKLVIDEPTTK